MARNLTVLIVDPNLDSRLDVSTAVDAIGLDRVGETGYGTEATFMATQHRPNVILVGLEDPPVRGLATLDALQQLPDIPVLVYSSSITPALMRQAMRAGARDFLEKPVVAAELQEVIHGLLAQEEQRQLARWSDQPAANARGTVITVAGAKGGIGKSTISTNLAVLLRQISGQDVALIDSDAQFGDVAVMLDLPVEHSIADLARNEGVIDRDTVRRYLARHESGVDVLLAASEPDDWRAVQAPHLAAMINALTETHEYVVVDTPGVMNDAVATSLHEAAFVLLVTSLDVSSVKDTKTAVRILDAWGVPRDSVRLLANDCTRAAAVSPEDVERATGLKVSYTIPYDPTVGVSVQTGTPVVISQPTGKYARALRTVAEALAGVSEAPPQRRVFAIGGKRLPLVGRRA
ncbi:MAG: P-loop NTPase [Dehalococcoidia bacterium]